MAPSVQGQTKDLADLISNQQSRIGRLVSLQKGLADSSHTKKQTEEIADVVPSQQSRIDKLISMHQGLPDSPPSKESQARKTSTSGSEGGAGYPDASPDTPDFTRAGILVRHLKDMGNLDRAAHTTILDLLEKFFDLRGKLDCLKLDNAMYVTWLPDSTRTTYPHLYRKHANMGNLSPSLTSILLDLNAIDNAEERAPRLATAGKASKQRDREGRCVWCQKRHGGRVCFWVFPEELPHDWNGRPTFLRAIQRWQATDEGRKLRELALSHRHGVGRSNEG